MRANDPAITPLFLVALNQHTFMDLALRFWNFFSSLDSSAEDDDEEEEVEEVRCVALRVFVGRSVFR